MEAIDWAVRENSRKGSKFYGKLDTTKIAAAGQSCGGGQAFDIAGDPRLTTVGILRQQQCNAQRRFGSALSETP